MTPCAWSCASANSGATCPTKERSPTRRSYLIGHQSFPLLPARIQVNYLDLGRICSSARKWLFFSTVRGLPILDHVILFCRLVHGAWGGGGSAERSLCRPGSLFKPSFIPSGSRSKLKSFIPYLFDSFFQFFEQQPLGPRPPRVSA